MMRVQESPQPSRKQAAPAACQSGCSWEWGLSPSWGSHRGPSVLHPQSEEELALSPGGQASYTWAGGRQDLLMVPEK